MYFTIPILDKVVPKEIYRLFSCLLRIITMNEIERIKTGRRNECKMNEAEIERKSINNRNQICIIS